MKKKLFSILTVIMVLLVAVMLVACQDYTKNEDESKSESTPTYTHTIANGTFYNAKTTSTSTSGDTSILDEISDFTQSSASKTTSANGSGGVMSAVINIANESDYNLIKEKYLTITTDESGEALTAENYVTLDYPGLDTAHTPEQYVLDEDGNKVKNEDNSYKKQKEDTNVLVLANVETAGSHFVKNKSQYTLKKDKTYLFQFSVCSKIYTAESYNVGGAWFVMKGDVEYVVPNINTNGEWKTYYLFIETNKTNDVKIDIELWLGYGPGIASSDTYKNDKKDIYSVRGVALFDNVICEEVDLAKGDELISDADKTANGISFGEFDANLDNYAFSADRFASLKANLTSGKDSNNYKYAQAKSVYYMEGADLSNRKHVTSYTTNSYRKYFYSFREDYENSNLDKYSMTTSESSLNARYYGYVNLDLLYDIAGEEVEDTSTITDNYTSLIGGSSYNINMMSYDEWLDVVMNSNNHKISELDSTYALMIYNKDLQANSIKSKEDIIIEDNSYYEISVWAYVWAKEYNGDFTYFADFGTSAPKDPRTDDKKWSSYEKYVYKLSQLNNAEKFSTTYFNDLTDEEKTKANAFNSDNCGVYEYNDGANFADMMNGTKAFIINALDLTITADSITNADVQYFYYYYVYNTIKDDNTVDDAVKTAVENAYLSQRKENISKLAKLNKDVEDYEEENVKYLSDKEAYNAKYNSWINAGNTIPYATVKLTGVDDGLTKNTTTLSSWQKITFYVAGSQLTSRKLNLEFCLGTGDDYANKMIGGVFFNDISIKRYNEDNKPAVEFENISVINEVGQVQFGDLYEDDIHDVDQTGWVNKLNEDTATNDAANVTVTLEETVDEIIVSGNQVKLSTLKFNNAVATASSVSYQGENVLTIASNKFYRFGFMVKTVDVDSTLGISITLLSGKDKSNIETALDSSITAYSTDSEWAEVVYYIKGDIADTYYMTIKVNMGDGNRFDISKYVKGTTYLKAFNLMEIEYDEYSSASTGDKIVKGVSISAATYGIDSDSILFTNSHYSDINYEKTSKDEFDENNQLTGIGSINSWTYDSEIQNTYDTPTEVTLDSANKVFKFKGSTGSTGTLDVAKVKPVKYEIWMKYIGDDNKEVEKLYDIIMVQDTDSTDKVYEYNLPDTACKETRFAVKAVGSDGISSLSTYTSNYIGSNESDVILEPVTAEKASKAEAGAIVVSNHQADNIFGANPETGVDYVSAYPTILKITSPYKVAYGLHSSSVSLEADGYYKISVWAKTEVGTKASIVLGGTSGSLIAETDDTNLGFVNVDTAGKWVEYSFFIKTSNFSTSMYIKFTLGNPNAKKLKGSDSDSTYYNSNELSSGTAYFDAARVTAIDEEEYIDAKELNDNKGDAKYASDYHKYLYTITPYYIYTMNYIVDSFDAFTAPTSSATELGNVPSNYSAGYETSLSSGTSYSTYGVYNVTDSSENMVGALKYLYSTKSGSSDVTYSYNDIFADKFENVKFNDKGIKDWEDEEWNEFLKEFLSVNRKNEDGDIIYYGGQNVLALSNKAEGGYSRYYSLSSSYRPKAAAGKYYVITFTARTLIAGVTTTTTTAEDGTETKQYTYSTEKAYGEFRVTPDSDKDETISTKISSLEYGSSAYDAVTYRVYLYNPTESDKNISWSFYLGNNPVTINDDNKDKVDEDLNQLIVGLMSVDLVSCEEITKERYDSAVANIDEEATSINYEYKATEEETEPEKDPEEETQEDSFWTRLVNNQYFWLYISSFVIALVIIIVVIVVVIRNWKKRHPKKQEFQNDVKTEKDIKIEETSAGKEEVVEDDEYSDTAAAEAKNTQPKAPKKPKEKKNTNTNVIHKYKSKKK
ncbi:MAG: hypothetical protein K5765_07220 [Clostridia bacterium]|nr:hypothetical protein [Clostridia bacterium]